MQTYTPFIIVVIVDLVNTVTAVGSLRRRLGGRSVIATRLGGRLGLGDRSDHRLGVRGRGRVVEAARIRSRTGGLRLESGSGGLRLGSGSGSGITTGGLGLRGRGRSVVATRLGLGGRSDHRLGLRGRGRVIGAARGITASDSLDKAEDVTDSQTLWRWVSILSRGQRGSR